MKKLLMPLAAGALVAFASGCLSTPLALVPSTDPIEQGKYSVLGSEVSGTDTQVSFLFLTFGAHGSGIRRAINDALSQAPGSDALVRVAMEDESFWFIIFNFSKVRVTGTPVKCNQN